MTATQKLIALVFELLLIVGGALALSNLIIASKPDAKAIIDKIVPFQALIGVVLLVLSIVFFVLMGPVAMFKAIKVAPLPAMANLAGVVGGFLLGAIFGMVQIAKASPQNAQRGVELTQKIAPYQALIGLVALLAGAVGLLYTTGIIKIAAKVGLDP